MTLYEIKSEYLAALDNIEVDEDGVIVNADELETLAGQFDEKAEAVGLYIKNLEAEEKAIKAEMDSLKGRAAAKAAKAERLKEYLAGAMLQTDRKVLETAKIRLSFRRSVAVVIDNEAEIPAEYMRVKHTEMPDKVALKDALKAGEDIPGARLEECQNLQIK